VYPRSGGTHDAECCFYRANPSRSGQKQYSQGVIREDHEGYVHVLLDTPLQVNSRAAPIHEGIRVWGIWPGPSA
jgi:hypothetical protein